MPQALVVSTLLLFLGGAVLASLRGLLGRGRLPSSLVRLIRNGGVVVILATLVGEGGHQHGLVVYCCLIGGLAGQALAYRSRLERATVGIAACLCVGAAWCLAL